MTPLILENGRARAAIAVELGFNCYEFRADVDGRLVDVIDSLPTFLDGLKRPTHSGVPILFPFPNRIREGRFRWDGVDYRAPVPPERPDAIHGFALDTPWRVIEQSATHAVGRWQLSVDVPALADAWPADCIIDVRYDLESAALRAKFRIANPDARPLPWGLGTHTYFKLPLGPNGTLAACELHAPAHMQWTLENCLPTGGLVAVAPDKDLRGWRPIGTTALDDVYTDIRATSGAIESIMRDPSAGLEIVQTTDSLFRELVVFTPPNRSAVCMEPYTCTTDAINLQQQGQDAGWHVLAPGEEVRTWIDIAVRTSGVAVPAPRG